MSEKAARNGLVAALLHLQVELGKLGIGEATAIELPTAGDGGRLKAALAQAMDLMPVYSAGRRTLPPNEVKLMGVTFRWPGAGDGDNAPPDLLEAIDRFVAQEHPEISRAEAIGLALRDWAIGHGYLPNPPAKEEAN